MGLGPQWRALPGGRVLRWVLGLRVLLGRVLGLGVLGRAPLLLGALLLLLLRGKVLRVPPVLLVGLGGVLSPLLGRLG